MAHGAELSHDRAHRPKSGRKAGVALVQSAGDAPPESLFWRARIAGRGLGRWCPEAPSLSARSLLPTPVCVCAQHGGLYTYPDPLPPVLLFKGYLPYQQSDSPYRTLHPET
jgi:hypothetical protein